MPRLSLYRATKTNDFNFHDRTIREQFDIGGTAIHVHKYLGPKETINSDDPTEPNYGTGLELDPTLGIEINPDGFISPSDSSISIFV